MKVWSDSSSARQLCKKRGPGRVRHLDLRMLFVQDLVENKQLRVGSISGDRNPADVLTKILGETGLRKHFSVIGLKELSDENVSFSRTVVDEQVRRNGLLAGCFASMVTQGMGQRIKTNVTETHVVTDVHVDMVNSATIFHLTGYILVVPIVIISFLLGWYVGLRMKSTTLGWSWIAVRWMQVKWITLLGWTTARLIGSTVA